MGLNSRSWISKASEILYKSAKPLDFRIGDIDCPNMKLRFPFESDGNLDTGPQIPFHFVFVEVVQCWLNSWDLTPN